MDLFCKNLPNMLVASLLNHGVKILLILIGMWIAIKMARVVGRKIIKITADNDPTTENERERRVKTLVQIFTFACKVLIISIGGMTIVKEVGIDIGPIL